MDVGSPGCPHLRITERIDRSASANASFTATESSCSRGPSAVREGLAGGQNVSERDTAGSAREGSIESCYINARAAVYCGCSGGYCPPPVAAPWPP